MAEQDRQVGLREQMLAVLLEHIDADPFPSATQMDRAEELLSPETAPVYARVLMDKIRRDPFPSLDMIDRVIELT